MTDRSPDLARDPILLSQALIREATVNPCHDGAQDVLAAMLEAEGFRTKRYHFEGVDNLYARIGTAAPNFCFAGHTDVVPVGDTAGWTVDPFGAEIKGGILYGRGACDMKTAIAAFAVAAARYLDDHGTPKGSISLLITGDEEGPGLHGTRRLLPAVIADGEKIDHCIVGEPTSEDIIADIVKNGRRGSLNAVLKATGKQGHVAYPEKSANPMPVLLDALDKIRGLKLDTGSPGFQPSNLEVTTIDVGNPAHNVIPAIATAKFNIRFNPNHKGDDLMERLRQLIGSGSAGVKLDLDMRVSGEAFYTAPGRLTDLIVAAVKSETGRSPALTTGGGTSDARYIKDVCPVAELGVRNEMAHKVDEHIPVDEIETLCRIYYRLLAGYFAAA
jgi:succinyl-diaminopimelate desuccinylase